MPAFRDLEGVTGEDLKEEVERSKNQLLEKIDANDAAAAIAGARQRSTIAAIAARPSRSSATAEAIAANAHSRCQRESSWHERKMSREPTATQF